MNPVADNFPAIKNFFLFACFLFAASLVQLFSFDFSRHSRICMPQHAFPLLPLLQIAICFFFFFFIIHTLILFISS